MLKLRSLTSLPGGWARNDLDLLMRDEFPRRFDFFESTLAFMADYGLKNVLLAPGLKPDRVGLPTVRFTTNRYECGVGGRGPPPERSNG